MNEPTKPSRRYRSVTEKRPLREVVREFLYTRNWVRYATRFEEVMPDDPGYEDALFEEVFFRTVGYQGEFKWVNIPNQPNVCCLCGQSSDCCDDPPAWTRKDGKQVCGACCAAETFNNPTW